jgi:hypothetical protein
MADRTRPDDVSKGKVYNQAIGIVVGPDVKVRIELLFCSAFAEQAIEDWSREKSRHF